MTPFNTQPAPFGALLFLQATLLSNLERAELLSTTAPVDLALQHRATDSPLATFAPPHHRLHSRGISHTMPTAPQPTLVLSPRLTAATLADPTYATASTHSPLPDHLLSTCPPNHLSPLTDLLPRVRDASSPSSAGTRSLAAADFDVCALSGFLPSEPPVERLGSVFGGGWESYEAALESVQAEVKPLAGGGVGRVGDRWRSHVQQVGHSEHAQSRKHHS